MKTAITALLISIAASTKATDENRATILKTLNAQLHGN